MKPLLTTLLLILLFSMAQEGEIFDVVVTDVKDGRATVVLDLRNPQCTVGDQRSVCDHDTLDIQLSDWPASWPKAEVGALFRATWIDQKLRFVSACPGRISRILDSPSYDKRPLNATRDPDGCDGQGSKFIRELLSQMNK